MDDDDNIHTREVESTNDLSSSFSSFSLNTVCGGWMNGWEKKRIIINKTETWTWKITGVFKRFFKGQKIIFSLTWTTDTMTMKTIMNIEQIAIAAIGAKYRSDLIWWENPLSCSFLAEASISAASALKMFALSSFSCDNCFSTAIRRLPAGDELMHSPEIEGNEIHVIFYQFYVCVYVLLCGCHHINGIPCGDFFKTRKFPLLDDVSRQHRKEATLSLKGFVSMQFYTANSIGMRSFLENGK